MASQKYSVISQTKHRKNIALLRAAGLDMLNDGVMIVSPSGIIAEFNAAVARISQMSRAQIFKQNVAHLSSVLQDSTIR